MNTQTPDLKEINSNRYIGTTARTPRPVPPADGKFGSTGRESLANDQKAWDSAKTWDDQNAEIKARRFAAIDAKREADRDARRQETAAVVLDELRQRYLRSDPTATAEDFEADKAELLRQRRIAAALEEPTKVGLPAGYRIG